MSKYLSTAPGESIKKTDIMGYHILFLLLHQTFIDCVFDDDEYFDISDVTASYGRLFSQKIIAKMNGICVW